MSHWCNQPWCFAFDNALKWYYARNVKGYYRYLYVSLFLYVRNAINYKGICGINTIDTLTSRIFFECEAILSVSQYSTFNSPYFGVTDWVWERLTEWLFYYRWIDAFALYKLASKVGGCMILICVILSERINYLLDQSFSFVWMSLLLIMWMLVFIHLFL